MSQPIDPVAGNVVAAAPSLRRRVWHAVRKAGPAGPFAAAVVVLPLIGGLTLLSVLRQLAPWCRDNAGSVAPFAVTGAGAMVVGFCLLPSYAVSLLAGWSFGFVAGFVVAVAAITAASLMGYGIARTIVGDHLLHSVRENPKWDAIRRAMVGRGVGRAMFIVILIRLAPVAPFGITNLLMASARCPVSAFVLGSALGVMPQTALLTFAASRMSTLKFQQEPWMVGLSVASTIAVIIALGVISRRALARATAA